MSVAFFLWQTATMWHFVVVIIYGTNEGRWFTKYKGFNEAKGIRF